MAKVSIIIPSRSEQFLVKTVTDVLEKAAGDIEVIPVLDGYWEPALPEDPRVRVLHHGEALGMRPSINHAARIATGEYFLKADAHTMWDEGFDEKLKADYHERNWILTPRRYPLEPEAWTIEQRADNKYPIDYEYLSYPFERPGDPNCGLHGTAWKARRDARKHILLDSDLSSQGSCWFMHREHWSRLGEMNIGMFGNFYGESQEIGLKTQLTGGAMMRTKNTFYCHLRKGKKYGRGYVLGPDSHKRGAASMLRLCMLDRWPGQTRTLQSLIEEFMPVPGWPPDLDECFRSARALVAA